MKSKTKIVLTVVILLLDAIIYKIWNFLYSVTSSVATSNSLKDDVGSYSIAKFIRDGQFDNLLAIVTLILLILIWSFSSKNDSKK